MTKATMMPVTVNPATTRHGSSGTSLFYGKLNKATNYKRGIRKPSTKKVGDKPLLSVPIFVQAAWNNVLLAVPALLYAIENYIRFTPPPPRLLSLKGMSRWLKIAMDVASAAILAVAQCMEAAEVSRAERAFGLCCQRCHQCSFCRRYLTLTAGEPQV
ncbi:hypothetical protein HID58_024989 [Brassica napus]|uniref:CASP-like protein n=1 Tax=Brassica napus TaxID=3708 RepID=A0ABQ8CJQ8_BRANA|nr:hypothetical protein HID58_024989 [Brassica napus]